jgi:hypothetical protein
MELLCCEECSRGSNITLGKHSRGRKKIGWDDGRKPDLTRITYAEFK